MLKIYGSMLCQDCVDCRKALDEANVSYIFLDFADDLQNLKEFLVLRDTREEFSGIRGQERIGIPCIQKLNNSITFSWEEWKRNK